MIMKNHSYNIHVQSFKLWSNAWKSKNMAHNSILSLTQQFTLIQWWYGCIVYLYHVS